MNRPIRTTAAMLALGLLLAGCSADTGAADPTATGATSGVSAVEASDHDLAPAAVIADNADYTTVHTDEWSQTDAVEVTLNGIGATSSDDRVSVSGSTITISDAGVYALAGALNGQVLVDAPEDALVVLVLDGVQIANDTGPAIEVRSAGKVAVHLADGSTNTVSDATAYGEDADANAAIWAGTNLTVSGEGALTVTGNGEGIAATRTLAVLAGDITVTAAGDALRSQKALVVEGGALELTATEGDGLKADGEDDWTEAYIYVFGGTLDITAGDDGLQAQTDAVIAGGEVTASVADDGVKGEVIVSVGTFERGESPIVTVTASTEAVEAANIGISDGTLDLTASDDGINASGNAELQATMAGEEYVDDGSDEMMDTGERLEISGGSVTIDAEGDGIDSNGTLTISGGDVTVYGPTSGADGALDSNGTFSVIGGTVLAFGSGGMEQTPGTDGQGWVLVSAQLSAGQSGEIVEDAGNTIVEFTSRKGAGAVTFSSESVTSGSAYSVTSGGSTLGTATAGEGGTRGPGGSGGRPPAMVRPEAVAPGIRLRNADPTPHYVG